MHPLHQKALELFAFTRDLRRDIHRHPELGFKEIRTAGIVARELSALGLEVHAGIAGTGVIGILEGRQPGPVVMARFDMDALPVQEGNDTSYRSETNGVMHACGHDGHVAVGLTVARMLAALKEDWAGTVKLVFQPAEEGLGGAEKMIEAGALQSPRPEASLALHLWNERPVGWVGAPDGPLMAGADTFRVKVTGVGGHGAAPHLTVDPIQAAAQMVTALQTIVSRNVSPLDTAVVTVAYIRGGEAYNVIPQTVEMGGTIRTFKKSVRERVMNRIDQILTGVAAAMNCQVEWQVTELTPPVVNDPQAADAVRVVCRDLFPQAEIDSDCRTMVSEDMAFFLDEVPGCYFLVGSANIEKGFRYGHHHPKFDIDEDALPIAAALMTGAILNRLR